MPIVQAKALSFLVALQAVESSNGVDMAHKVIESPTSMHVGQRAVGRFALMPNTIAQITRGKQTTVKPFTEAELRLALDYTYYVHRRVVQRTGCQGDACYFLMQEAWLMGPGGIDKGGAIKNRKRLEKFKKVWETIWI
jgi:hypothetical protein